MMQFIPPWERPPEPDAQADLAGWCQWRIDCGGPDMLKEVFAKITTHIDAIKARLPEQEKDPI